MLLEVCMYERGPAYDSQNQKGNFIMTQFKLSDEQHQIENKTAILE